MHVRSKSAYKIKERCDHAPQKHVEIWNHPRVKPQQKKKKNLVKYKLWSKSSCLPFTISLAMPAGVVIGRQLFSHHHTSSSPLTIIVVFKPQGRRKWLLFTHLYTLTFKELVSSIKLLVKSNDWYFFQLIIQTVVLVAWWWLHLLVVCLQGSGSTRLMKNCSITTWKRRFRFRSLIWRSLERWTWTRWSLGSCKVNIIWTHNLSLLCGVHILEFMDFTGLYKDFNWSSLQDDMFWLKQFHPLYADFCFHS